LLLAAGGGLSDFFFTIVQVVECEVVLLLLPAQPLKVCVGGKVEVSIGFKYQHLLVTLPHSGNAIGAVAVSAGGGGLVVVIVATAQ